MAWGQCVGKRVALWCQGPGRKAGGRGARGLQALKGSSREARDTRRWGSQLWLSLQGSLGGHLRVSRHPSLWPSICGPPTSPLCTFPHPNPRPVWPQLGSIRACRPMAASPSLKNVFVILAAGQITVTNGPPAPQGPQPIWFDFGLS